MSWDTAQQLLRILLQLGAGVLISRGYLTDETATTVVGSILTIGGVVWWAVWEKTTRPATVAEKASGQA